jgi:glycine/D-amino acid oxidase-like deaminating enzyme
VEPGDGRPSEDVSATHHRDLRTGRSVWEGRRLPPLAGGPLGRRRAADVLVVGAGISGAMVAEALSEAGLRVLVVDRRRPLAGSTSASTALLQYDLDLPLLHLARRIGQARAVRVWRRSKLALDALRERVRRLSIDADCVERDSLYLDGDVLDAAELKQEGDARRRAGFEVSFLPSRTVAAEYGIRGRSGLLSRGNLAADPRRLANGFLRAAVARGACVAWPVEVTSVDPRANRVRALTSDGKTLEARHLVFATGYELPKGVPRAGHAIASTWAIATKPQPRRLWPGRCFIWEASDPYLYVRVDPEGRVLCGGEDEPFADAAARDALLPAKTRALERRLHALLPGIDPRAELAWCGSFGASATGTPSIGPVPGLAHCYAVLGYGGNGITFSALAAQVLRSRILGATDPDADLFAFGRARR